MIVSKYKSIPNNDDVDKKVIPAIGPYNRKVMGINKKNCVIIINVIQEDDWVIYWI